MSTAVCIARRRILNDGKMNRRTMIERQGMCAKAVLIAMTSMMMTSFVASAAEPYQAKVGDQLVTSVTRPVTRGLGLGREELLQAARTSQPLQAVPSNAVPDIPSGNSAPPNSSNDDRR